MHVWYEEELSFAEVKVVESICLIMLWRELPRERKRHQYSISYPYLAG